MVTVTIQEAQATLPQLVRKLSPREEVLITENDHTVAKLVAPRLESHQPRPGRCKGMLTIVEEDDEHLEDFKEYMP